MKTNIVIGVMILGILLIGVSVFSLNRKLKTLQGRVETVEKIAKDNDTIIHALSDNNWSGFANLWKQMDDLTKK